MNPAFFGLMMVFLAMAFVIVLPITAMRLRHRQKLEEMRLGAGLDGADAARAAQQAGRIDVLEDRVQVLERIITDHGYGVAAQIEALRDNRSIEELKRNKDKV